MNLEFLSGAQAGRLQHIAAAAAGFALIAACATVKVEAPDKPIEINLNVKVEGEVLVKLDREIDDLIASNPDIF